MTDLNSMQPRDLARPGYTSSSPTGGASLGDPPRADKAHGKSLGDVPEPRRPPQADQAPSALVQLMDGGAAPTGSQPTSGLSADGTRLFTEAGQIISQGFPANPVGFVPGGTGDSSNVVSGQGDIGFPRAGDGPGTGLVTKPGVVGQTLAKPRGTPNPGFSGPRK